MPSELVSTQLECEQAADLLDKLDGGPWPGVHAGGGTHCDMPASWDGTGSIPEGWTTARQQTRDDLDADGHATGQRSVALDRLATLASKPAYRARLNQAQRDKLDDVVGRLQTRLARLLARD